MIKAPNIQEAHTKILRYGSNELEEAHKDWGKPETPRVFTYNTEGGQIVMLGTAHTKQLEDPGSQASEELQRKYKMLQQVVTEGNNYLNRTPQNKALVMVEGFHGGIIPQWSSIEEAVAASGEMGAVSYMAYEKGVEVVSPEVKTEEVVEKLKAQGVPTDRVALFYTLRAMPNVISQGKIDELPRHVYHAQLVAGAEWVQPLTNEEEQRIILEPEEAKRKGEEVLKACIPKLNGAMQAVNGQNVFDEATGQILISEDELTELTSPRSEKFDTPLNQISRVDNETRDDYLLDEIHKATENGKSPLVVFGGTHALKVNPALRYLHPN